MACMLVEKKMLQSVSWLIDSWICSFQQKVHEPAVEREVAGRAAV